MLVTTAAVTTATGTTNQVASAAAPHVKKAAAQRYSGPDAMSTMYGDAKTAATVGAAVAKNPAGEMEVQALPPTVKYCKFFTVLYCAHHTHHIHHRLRFLPWYTPARALGSAMFSAAVDGAKAANQAEGKSVSGTSILLSATQGAFTTASNSQQQRR